MYTSYITNQNSEPKGEQPSKFNYSDSGIVSADALLAELMKRRPRYVPMYNGQR